MSFFRGLFAVVVMLGVAVFSTGAFAAVPLTLTHQGRLLDATDKPVNDFFDITYRIFDVPSGGSPLWTEVHASVQVADGLFSALLGSTVPLSADVLGSSGGGGGGTLSTRYLEVSVGGTTLSPRLALSSVPSAISSGHVSGDIETAPGMFTVTNNGSATTGALRCRTMGDSVVLVLDHDSDGDGVPETSLSSSCDASGASQVMEKKGLNAVNVKLARTISSTPSGSVAQDYLDMDSDDDGVMDRSVSSDCDDTSAKHAVKTKGTGANLGRTASASSSTDESSASVVCGLDTDGDGVPESDLALSVGIGATAVKGTFTPPGLAHPRTLTESSTSTTQSQNRVAYDEDCNGEAEDEIAQVCTPISSSVAIKTKGTGADKNRTASISSSTGLSSASVACDIDDDGDGVPESEISQHLTPTASSVAIKTKGTGADNNRSASLVCATDIDGDGTFDRSVSTTADSTTAGIAIDEPGVQIAMDARKGWDGTVKGRIAIDESGVHRVLFDSDGNGVLSGKVGIGKTPVEKIDVEGGAYCDGTNWVNASDRNSKENFTAVDGNELLDQIAQLSITRWNYKGNNQAEHIGPTAQDFKAAFGVGANDKSISTIDPSGIALAAIKALNSKMQELNTKTTQLEDQAHEITQLKAELVAIKAMLQKQAATKN